MKARILLIGEDEALLQTRAKLLADWETVTVNSTRAITALETQHFDLVVIGHSVPENSAIAVISAAGRLVKPVAILAIRLPGEEDHLGVETHTSDLHESPGWLPKRVSALLAERLDG